MRVSNQSRQNAQLQYLRTVNGRMDEVQRQLATGKRIQRPSDDPAGVSQSMRLRDGIAFEAQMRRNIEGGVAFLNVTESALDGATQALQRLRELTVQAANGTLSGTERQSIAREVDQLTREVVQLGNTQFNGAYVFSGHATATPAYSMTGHPPTAISFDGDTGQRVRRISAADEVAVNVAGADVFGTIFDELIQLREDLDGGAPTTAIQNGIGSIDAALDRVLKARADAGARINRLESTAAMSERTDLDLQQLTSSIEDVDFAEAIIRLNGEQVALQAALGAIGRAAGTTLLDYLR